MISVNQPYFFANIGYFSLLAQSSTHVFYDDVNMKKKSWITRNKFSKSDKIYSIKVKNLSQNRKIFEHHVLHAKSVFFDLQGILCDESLKYSHQVDNILSRCKDSVSCDVSVAEFNIITTMVLSSSLRIKCAFRRSSEMNLPKNVIGAKRLSAITKALGATDYLNLESGRLLYNLQEFQNEGIALHFNDTQYLRAGLGGDDYFKSILYVIAKYGLEEVQYLLHEKISYVS